MTQVPGALVKRDRSTCTKCSKCESACPAGVMIVDLNSNYLWTSCRQCGACIDACPAGALSWEQLPSSTWEDRAVRYFARPGPQDTMAVVEVVQQRLQTGDISAVVTGSSSGASAMLLVDSGLPTGCRVINVSAPADAFERFGFGWRAMTAEAKAELARRGITLLEQAADWRAAARALCHCSNTAETVRCARPDLLFYETLIDVGGMGLKTAVECVLDACLQREVEVGERVIGVAGTGRGFDTAAVIRATIPASVFGQDPSERPEVEEILATPRPKQRYY